MINGIPIIESWYTPRDQIFLVDNRIVGHPSTIMAMKHGRTPLWTRHMLGVSEAERDRRKHRS
jgi:hypothetical protein